MQVAGLLVAATVLRAAVPSSAVSEDFLLKVGEAAPPFSMRDLDKKMFSVANHVGKGATDPKKAMLIIFFATWCEPCKKEIPIIKNLYSRWKAKGVEVAYVGLSQGAAELGPFAKEQKFPWRVIPDSFGLLARRYGVSQLPHVFLVGPDGNIAFQHRGIAPDLKQTLEARIALATGEQVPPEIAEQPPQVDRPRFERTMLLGRAPANTEVAGHWQPLAAFVGEQVHANVEISTETDYAGFEAALKAGKFDIANAGPMLIYANRDKYEPVVRLERQGSATYLGLIFTGRDSPAKSIADLRGKTVGLVSQSSTSGGLYAELALIDAGLVPDRDVTIKWLGSHAKVAEAVKAGTVDAGGCFEDCRDLAWPNARDKASMTRVLGYTEEIPGEMVVVRRDLDAATKKAVRDAFLSLPAAAGLLAQISSGELAVTGFVATDDKDLTRIEAALARLAAAHQAPSASPQPGGSTATQGSDAHAKKN